MYYHSQKFLHRHKIKEIIVIMTYEICKSHGSSIVRDMKNICIKPCRLVYFFLLKNATKKFTNKNIISLSRAIHKCPHKLTLC